MKQKLATTILAIAVLESIGLTTVMAADNKFYAYVSAGSSDSSRKAETDTAIANSGITAFTSSEDAKDTAYKLQIGYQVNRHLAIEGGYVDMGKFTYRAAATAPVTATRDGDVKASGWNIGVVGVLPFTDKLSGFGKAGVIAYDLKYACRATGIACTSPDRSTDGTPLYYGLGLDWRLSREWFVRAEYEVFQDIGDSFNSNGTTGTTKADVKISGIGVGYRF
jgi:OOP family OmpA-OmpF porin